MQYSHKTRATSPGPGPIVYMYIYIYISYTRALDGLLPRSQVQVGGVLRVEHLIALEWVLPPAEVPFNPGRRQCMAESTLATSSTMPATLPLRTAVACRSRPKVEGPLMLQRVARFGGAHTASSPAAQLCSRQPAPTAARATHRTQRTLLDAPRKLHIPPPWRGPRPRRRTC